MGALLRVRLRSACCMHELHVARRASRGAHCARMLRYAARGARRAARFACRVARGALHVCIARACACA
eukprot:11091954-Alexandrium_andersonii.AAC.1